MVDYIIPTGKEIAKKANYLITADLSKVYSLPILASECVVTPYN